jgi:hypothetical protein
MKKITHYAAAPYLTKILVNRKVKAPFEINTVTKVKLYSNSFKLYRRNYQCNLRAIVRTYYDKQQIFFANIVYSSRIEFLAAPDLKIDAEVEHVMKNVAPKEALFDVLRNKVYTVMQDSGLSPYMISDNCDYQYIEEENDYDDPDTDKRIGDVIVHLKKGKWESFTLDSFNINGAAEGSIQIKEGQYILLQFRNNSGIRIFDIDKQLYIDPQSGLELQKAEITMTNLLIRALDIGTENESEGGE